MTTTFDIKAQIEAVRDEVARLEKVLLQADAYDSRSVLRLTLRRDEWRAVLATLQRCERLEAVIAKLREHPEELRAKLKQHPSYSCECLDIILNWLDNAG
jgi:hypothetical protein